VDSSGEVVGVLEQEAVAGVGVNPQLRVRQPVGEQVRIARRHHAVVVAVGDEYGLRDASEPVELARFGDAPCVDRVQLRVARRERSGRVAVLGADEDALDEFPARRDA
jgi:hypothetical protein